MNNIGLSDVKVYLDKTPGEHQAQLDALSQQGYRMVSLSVYGTPPNALYAAVWLKQDGPPWITCHSQTRAGYQQFFDAWTAKGYRPVMVAATGTGTNAVFAALFEQSPSPGWFARHDLVSGPDHDPNTFQYHCKVAQANGDLLTWATVYGDAAHPYFAGIWEKNAAYVPWSYQLGQNNASLQSDIDSFTASGGTAELITRSAAPNSYLSIWHQVAMHEWWADYDLNTQAFLVKSQQNQARGIFPLRLQGSGVGNQTRFAVIWGYLPLTWLQNAEIFAGGYPDDLAGLAESKVDFILIAAPYVPINSEFIARCHSLGTRCLVYVTFFQGRNDNIYEGINLGTHPECIEIDASGQFKLSPYQDSLNSQNWYIACPNVQVYQDAMAVWVTKLMQLGADGVFVDNLRDRDPCCGPQFHKHQHFMADQNQAFAKLLARVRHIVKQYKSDGVVFGNSAYPPGLSQKFWPFLDADMAESYICIASTHRRWGISISAPVPNPTLDPDIHWKDYWNPIGDPQKQSYIQAGKSILGVSPK